MRRHVPLAVLILALALTASPVLALDREARLASGLAALEDSVGSSRSSGIESAVIFLVSLWEKYGGMAEPFGDEATSPNAEDAPPSESATLDRESAVSPSAS